MKKNEKDNSSLDLQVRLYTKKDCSLCVVAKETILRVQKKIPFDFQEVDIESEEDLYERFKYEIPVVFINDQRVFTYRVNGKELKRILVKFRENPSC